MSPGTSADRSASADGGAGADVPASADGAAPGPARTGSRRRWENLAGLTVHGSDGKTVGRVRDIYLHDATGELAAITVMPRQLSAGSVLIPAAAIASLPSADDAEHDHDVHLLVDTPTAKAGARPPHTLHTTPQDLREAAAALRLEGESSPA